jgi:hypothetical protein
MVLQKQSRTIRHGQHDLLQIGLKGQLPRKEKWYSRKKVEKNISSPHLVNSFATKILPKWVGMIWIGSLYYFSSISVLYGWKTLEESTFRSILVIGPNLEIWVQKTV